MSSLITDAQMNAYWMPYTSNREFAQNPRIITGAEGAYYIDSEGRRIFDGLSGLWTTGAGHNRLEIAEAVAKQLSKLDYAPAFQYGHTGAFELAEKLAHLAPGKLNHVFYTNSGSECTDTATKIARAYWRLAGQPTKTRIIGRAKGYHGASWGGISFGGIPANRKLWGLGIDADHLHHTSIRGNEFTKGMPQSGADLADELEDIITLHDASNVAAVIVEPIAGSAGVLVPPSGYLNRLREICNKHNVLLIFDEVITAFGRIGDYFAAETFGVEPDILNVAKQITNGAIPLGAVITSDDIYDAVMAAPAPAHGIELPHGYTYSGHPVACAAALAALDVLEKEQLVARVKSLAPAFETKIHRLKNCDVVTDIRNFGFAAGLTLAPKDGDPTLRPYEVAMKLWQRGFYVRYGGDTLQLGLPFITEESEMDLLVEAMGNALEEETP